MTNTDLRQMVRDILREVVPPKGAASAGVESVRIGNDADLMAFARRAIAPHYVDAMHLFQPVRRRRQASRFDQQSAIALDRGRVVAIGGEGDGVLVRVTPPRRAS